MGFFEAAMGAINAFNTSSTGHEIFRKWFQNASDEKLIEWWENRYNFENIDQEIIDMAEHQMRRRGLL